MPDRKFKLGDIVRCTPEGLANHVSGWRNDKLEVMSLCVGDSYQGDFLIKVSSIGYTCRMLSGAWREKWYEFVEPQDGPW